MPTWMRSLPAVPKKGRSRVCLGLFEGSIRACSGFRFFWVFGFRGFLSSMTLKKEMVALEALQEAGQPELWIPTAK